MTATPPRRYSRRRFLGLAGGAAGALLLGGCGRPGSVEQARAAMTVSGEVYDGPPIQLEFWNGFTGGDGPLLRELVAQFNDEHDNIAVRMNAMQWEEFYSTAPAAVATGRGADVAAMHLDQIGTTAARGVITPLDDLVEVFGLDESDFQETVWNAGLYDGHRFGIPLDVHPLGFYYNKDLMAEVGLDPESPPQDRESYEEALAAFRDAGIRGHWVPSMPFTGMLQFQSLLPQFGGQLYDEDGRATWDSAEAVEAAGWLLERIAQGDSPTDVAQDGEHVAFENAQTPFVWNGIWMVGPYSETEFETGVAPVPTIGDEPSVWASSHQLVIMNQPDSDEDRRQACAVFINYITEQSLLWAEAGQIPARESVRESEDFAALEFQSTIAEQLDHVRFLPTIPGVGDAQSQLETGWNEIALRMKTPEQALTDSADRANQLLEINFEKYGGEPA